MEILRKDSDPAEPRKLERRTSDWKPMQGVDRRTELKSDYSGSERRKYKRRKCDNDRRRSL